MDNNEIQARNNGSASNLLLQNDGGNVVVGGAVVHTSDRRLKKDIDELAYGLEEVLKLSPKQYHWKNKQEKEYKSLGLIAQEVRNIIPNIVVERDDETKTLSVNYTELIPVLINAIQQQQSTIEELKKERDSEKNNRMSLESRIERLEALISN
jgi:flagellar biosynthesis chaperone FliJ